MAATLWASPKAAAIVAHTPEKSGCPSSVRGVGPVGVARFSIAAAANALSPMELMEASCMRASIFTVWPAADRNIFSELNNVAPWITSRDKS